MKRLILIKVCCLILLMRESVRARETADIHSSWQDISVLLCDDAFLKFKRIEREKPELAREALFGQAVALLYIQPVTESNIEKASQCLRKVTETGPGDDLGISAQYYLGRIEQVHRFVPNRALACKIYDDLYAKHPSHPVAQRAFVKSSTLQIFDSANRSRIRELLLEFEKKGSGLTNADALRGFHWLMALAYRKFGQDDNARLTHLFAVEKTGSLKRDTRSDLILSIAETARRLKRTDIAARYYQLFVAEFPRDYRVFTVKSRCAELKEKK